MLVYQRVYQHYSIISNISVMCGWNVSHFTNVSIHIPVNHHFWWLNPIKPIYKLDIIYIYYPIYILTSHCSLDWFKDVYGKHIRKPPCLMVTTLVSCNFSLKPMLWITRNSLAKLLPACQGGHSRETCQAYHVRLAQFCMAWMDKSKGPSWLKSLVNVVITRSWLGNLLNISTHRIHVCYIW